MSTYYEILEVSASAETAEIKKAYRRLAKQYHPDLNPSPTATERFIKIEEAYSCLVHHGRRQSYNRMLRYQKAGKPGSTNARRANKYRSEVNQEASRARKRAADRARMSYHQYRRDEALLGPASLYIMRVLFAIITIALLIGLFVLLLYSMVDEKGDFPEEKTWVIYTGSIVFMPLVAVVTGLYEPLIRRLVVGKARAKEVDPHLH